VHRGYTCWDWRAFAGKRDVWCRFATHPSLRDERCALQRIACMRAPTVVSLGETMTTCLYGGLDEVAVTGNTQTGTVL
jgi:hypothetical protein